MLGIKSITVADMRPWSFSRVHKAKTCPFAFYFAYVEGLEPAPKADFFKIGSGVHFLLENALRAAFLKKSYISKENLRSLLLEYLRQEPDLQEKDYEPFFHNIVRYVNSHLLRMRDYSFFAAELELSVGDSFEPLPYNAKDAFLRGKLDLVYVRDKRVFIVDHKTNRSREFSNRLKTQLRWYALLAKSKFPEFSDFILEVHNVRYGTCRRFVFTDTDIDNFKLKLTSVIRELEEELEGKTLSELKPNPSYSNCKWCDFRHVCPESKA